MATSLRNAPSLLEALAGAVGANHLLTDEADRRFHGTDVFNAREIPVAVARPGNVAELQAVVQACAAAGAAVTVAGVAAITLGKRKQAGAAP
jgi:FAD/FMN-containing dehydrogenase